MGTKFDISLAQAMELLNLKPDFTEKEFKSNYRKLMINIHPDTLGNLNPIARKIIEEEAKRANIAKEVIESFLKGTYSNYNANENNIYYKRESANNNTEDNHHKEIHYSEEQRKETEKKQKQNKEIEKKYKHINMFLASIVIIAIIIIVIDVRNQNNTIKFQDKNLENVVRDKINKPEGPILKSYIFRRTAKFNRTSLSRHVKKLQY